MTAERNSMLSFPEKLIQFIDESEWIFAKTYAATWPHEYIVEQRVDRLLFKDLAEHIDTHGYESEFYTTKQIYFDHDGLTYWHMGNIINRCPKSETYDRRKAEGRLPVDKV
jgi:hypothetical protein